MTDGISSQNTAPRALTLSAEALALGYGDRTLVSGLSFTLPAGAFLAIVGESGCGKSTLLSALAGLRPAQGGTVTWRDAQGTAVPVRQLRSSFVWQALGLFPWKRVQENLELPLTLGAHAEKDAARRRERTARMLEELRLTGLESRFPSELSGGQRQRLALGRALIVRPEVLFLDEPFSALDALLRERAQDFLTSMRRAHPCSVIMVTHDIAEAASLASHVLLLSASGRAPVWFENPAWDAALGSADRNTEAFYAVQAKIRTELHRAGSLQEDDR